MNISAKKITIVIIVLLACGFAAGFFVNYFGSFNGKGNAKATIDSESYYYSAVGRKVQVEAAYEKISPKQNISDIKGAVVNHHLLASKFIASVFDTIASKKSLTIVIISPNHFGRGRGRITSSILNWKTPYGIMETDAQLIEALEQKKLLSVDPTPFKEEHGISNLMAFVKKSLPNAKVVPIIVRDNLSVDTGFAFAKALKEVAPSNTLVVASLDFSHYLPSNAADFHDEKTLQVINDFDYDGIASLDIDSKPAMNIILKYLELTGAQKFTQLDHSNSAKLTKDNSVQETTSYITGVFSVGRKAKRPTKTTLLAFGDLMLDRRVRGTIDSKGSSYPFKNILRFLIGSDIVLANAEGPFSDFTPKPIIPSNVTFTFDPKLVPFLKKIGFTMFGLANNHTLNFGQKGFEQTKSYFEANGLDYFGDPKNRDFTPIIKTIRGTKIAFLGANELESLDMNAMTKSVSDLRGQVDFIIVYMHWGFEYKTIFAGRQQTDGRKLIDAGADIVIGSHPHVMQPLELYKDKIIFYSLGNFLFDQPFSLETQQGLSVGMVLDKSQFEFYLFPIDMHGVSLSLLNKDKSDLILGELAKNSVGSEDFKAQVANGHIIINSEQKTNP